MLVYRPGSSSSCIALSVGDKPHPIASTVWSYIDLDSLAVFADHAQSASTPLENGSHASTSGTSGKQTRTNGHSRIHKRSASPEDDLSDLRHSAQVKAKKARVDEDTKFQRVMTHTFYLQPYRSTNSKEKSRREALPDVIQADLSSFPLLRSGELELAYLADSTSTHTRGSIPAFDKQDLVSCLALLLAHTQVLRLHGGSLRRMSGKAPNPGRKIPSKHTALEFHYALEIEICLNLVEVGHISVEGMKKATAKQIPVAVEVVLWYAFFKDRPLDDVINPVEIRANKRYTEVNLEWFYSCLPRPPVGGSYENQVEDCKGKGKAREVPSDIDETTGSRPIEPPGLVPHLHPFQCRSLEWMLYREGKVIAGDDEEGKHMVKSIEHSEQVKQLRRSVMWMKTVFDDAAEWWFCPTSLEFSKTDPAEAEEDITEGSILAEEMGLGKTVELLSLILLSQEPERNNLPVYDAAWLAADVRPSNLTLLVCPQAIIGQWQDEIARHAPSLRVLRYAGMRETFPEEDGEEADWTIEKFDIVLCDFDTMASDLAIARKPHLHNTRAQKARGGRVSYRRSVLVGIEWLRVVLDEAQMAASTTSAISETASWIPRKFSWAVSGTPIKQTIKDFAGLLKFLRVYDVGYSSHSFQRLVQPEYAGVFTTIVSQLGIRTVKAQIENELVLPPQERFVVPVAFTPVEIFNYRTKYGEALAELQVHMDASRLTGDWSMNRRLMSRWLHTLRQACFSAQAAQPDRPRAGNVKRAEETVVQTLDEILFDLRGKNISELHTDQRNAAAAKVKRGYRLMYDKEDCEKYEKGLKVLSLAKRDLHLLAQDIFNELLIVFPEARAATPDSRASSKTPDPELAGHPYLTVFRDTVKEMAERREANSTVKAKNTARIVTALTSRLRDALFIMHQAVFFTGNAYFNMGNKEEEETAAYAEADALRKQILHSDEREAMKEIRKLDVRVKEKRLKDQDLLFAMSDSNGGLQSHRTFELIALLSKKANEIATLMQKWRNIIIEALSSRLTEEEISDTEYQSKAEMQEKLDIYIEFLARIQADWVHLITGTRSTLAENPTAGGNANTIQGANDVQTGPSDLSAPVDATVSKRSKRKQAMNGNNKKVIIAAADPATKLRYELEEERKSVVPSFILKPRKKKATATRHHADMDEDEEADEDELDEATSLREQLRELQGIKELVVKEVEQDIVAIESSRLRKELAAKDKIMEQLRNEQNLFAEVYNGKQASLLGREARLSGLPIARVKYYRVMQEFGDSVAVLPDKETTPGALREEIAKLKQRESDLDHQMLPKIARRRYLDGLKDANLAEEGCLICANTEEDQMVLTHCGHSMHEKCLRTWCARSGSSTCPVCRASLARTRAWVRIRVKGTEMEVEGECKPEDSSKADPSVKTASDQRSDQLAAGTSANGILARTRFEEVDDDLDDPAKQLNLLAPAEVEAILDMPLQGASLGTKLDTIVKHVKLLRLRHQKAIEEYDEAISSRNAANHPTSASRTGPAPTEAKILIYSAWQYACDVLAAAFRREHIGHVRLEGGGKKENAPINFRENPDCAVFILHAKSQAAGLTLTAASYVFLVEPLLEPALETQAIARVHRIGQKKKTTVFQYIIPETVDERIALLSLRKWKHLIFSRAHSTGTVQESSMSQSPTKDTDVQAPVSRRTRGAEAQDKNANVDGDALSDEDLARLLLDKDGMASLQVVLDQVAQLKMEAEDAAVRERTEREILSIQIMQANAGNPAALADFDDWEIGDDLEDWMTTR